MSQQQSMQQRNERLMQGLRFTAQDIEANRGGILTENQRQNLQALVEKNQPIMWKVIGIVAAISVVGFGVVGGSILNDPATREGISDMGPMVAVFLIPIIAVFVIWPLTIWRGMRSAQALKEGRGTVTSVEGKVKLHSGNIGYSTAGMVASASGMDRNYYYIEVGRKKFYADAQSFAAFDNKLKYRVYYMKATGGGIIVSAEALD